MAGFIFSIGSTNGVNGVESCIRKGLFSARVPADLGSSMSRQVVASVLYGTFWIFEPPKQICTPL